MAYILNEILAGTITAMIIILHATIIGSSRKQIDQHIRESGYPDYKEKK